MSSKSFDIVLISIGNGINLIINFLTVPFLVRMLSYDDYGSYGQVLIVVNLLKEIFAYCLNIVCNSYYARKEFLPEKLFSNMMMILGGLAVIAVLLMASLSPAIAHTLKNDQLESLLYISLANLMFQIPFPVLFSTLVFFGLARKASSIMVISNLVRIILMLISIQIYHSVWVLMLSLSIASFLQFCFFYFAVPGNLRKFTHPDKNIITKLMITASPLVLTAIFERAVYYIDGLMISAMTTTKEYAFYRAGAFEVPFISAMFGFISIVVMPELAKLYINRDFNRIIELKRKAVSYTAFITYPIFIYLLFFSQPLVTFYLSAKYAPSAIIFTIFCFSLLIRINDYQDIIITFGRIRLLFYNMIWMVVLNIAVNYILIKLYGIAGSAVAFVLHLMIFAFVLSWFNSKILGCRMSDIYNFSVYVKTLMISLLIVLPVWILHCWVFTSIWFLILIAPVYALAVYFAGFKARVAEPEMFLQILHRIPLLNRLAKKP